MIHSSGNAAIAGIWGIIISHTIPSTVISLNPSVFDKISINCVVCFAIHCEQTRTDIDITAVNIGAHKFSVGNGVAMSGGGESCSPIDNGVADLAECPAGVAVLGAGGCLVGEGNCIDMVGRCLGIIFLCFRSVVVSAVPRGIVCGLRDVCPVMSLGIHLYL